MHGNRPRHQVRGHYDRTQPCFYSDEHQINRGESKQPAFSVEKDAPNKAQQHEIASHKSQQTVDVLGVGAGRIEGLVLQQGGVLFDLLGAFFHAQFTQKGTEFHRFFGSFFLKYGQVIRGQLGFSGGRNPLSEALGPIRTSHTRSRNAHQTPSANDQKQANQRDPLKAEETF